MMPKSLPVNRLVGQGVTMWGVSLPIRLSKPYQAGQEQVSSMSVSADPVSSESSGPLGLAELSLSLVLSHLSLSLSWLASHSAACLCLCFSSSLHIFVFASPFPCASS